MRCSTLLVTGAALALFGQAAAAPLPDSFSERARELLSGGAEINRPDEVGEESRKLNVIYFVGSDAEPLEDYQRRISELLLYLRQFYGREMARNGFGNRSMALPMKENGEVDITLIRGSRPAAEYVCSGEVAMDCLKEVEAYFCEHPERKFSRHTFIIMPTRYDEQFNDANPGGVPFFGMGCNCFVLDYRGFDLRYLGQDTPEGRLLTKMFGGLAHELGHAMNLPHNNGPVSELRALGTPLMGSDNYTFGSEPTYMTKASCAIMDTCEIVPRLHRPATLYAKPEGAPALPEPRLVYDGSALQLELRLPEACAEVSAANVYVQDSPFAVNQDYDSVAFAAQCKREGLPAGGVVCCTIPMAELANLKEDRREISALLLFPNGYFYRWSAQFNMSALKVGQAAELSEQKLTECER